MATAAPAALEEIPVQPLQIEPASTWADRPTPPPRDWVCAGLAIGAGRVISFIGNGGFGKTTIAAQIAVCTAASHELYGMPVNGGTVLGVFCEDEQEEIERRTRSLCEAEGIDLAALDNLYLLSRDGQDNVLCTFDRDQIVLTDFYRQLDATVATLKPRLTIIDTAADVFAGDFMSTPHVRQFIKVALGGLCVRHETAVLLLAHPSATAMASGDGGGFSTAWNNSVRSRLYLRRPKSDDAEAIADRRILEIKKSNYGPTGATIPLVYDSGRFILDPEPIEENAKAVRIARTDTRFAMSVMGHFRRLAPSGEVLAFGKVFEALQQAGDIPAGDYQKVRKPLQRCLTALVSEGLLKLSEVPRGYRLVLERYE
jgi:RecA-family ATPase